MSTSPYARSTLIMQPSAVHWRNTLARTRSSEYVSRNRALFLLSKHVRAPLKLDTNLKVIAHVLICPSRVFSLSIILFQSVMGPPLESEHHTYLGSAGPTWHVSFSNADKFPDRVCIEIDHPAHTLIGHSGAAFRRKR